MMRLSTPRRGEEEGAAEDFSRAEEGAAVVGVEEPGCSKDPIYMAEAPILKTVEHPVGEVVLDDVQCVEDTVQGISQMSHTDQDSTNVVEIAPEQTTLTDEDKILSEQPRKRKPKRKRSPSLLPTRRSKRLESVMSSVGVLQSEESSNTTPVHAEHPVGVEPCFCQIYNETLLIGERSEPCFCQIYNETLLIGERSEPCFCQIYNETLLIGERSEPCFCQIYNETLLIGERSEPCFCQIYNETLLIGERSEPCFCQIYNETLLIGERSEPCFCQIYNETLLIGERSEPCFCQIYNETLLIGERSEPCFCQIYNETLLIGERSEPCFCQIYNETLLIGERSEPCFCQIYNETLLIGERSEPCFCQIYNETLLIGERSEPCFCQIYNETLLIGERSEPCFCQIYNETLLIGERSEPCFCQIYNETLLIGERSEPCFCQIYNETLLIGERSEPCFCQIYNETLLIGERSEPCFCQIYNETLLIGERSEPCFCQIYNETLLIGERSEPCFCQIYNETLLIGERSEPCFCQIYNETLLIGERSEPCFCQIYNETLLIGERSEPCFCQIYNETLLIGERSEPCFCQIYNETLLIGERSEPCFCQIYNETLLIGERSEPCFCQIYNETLLIGERSEPCFCQIYNETLLIGERSEPCFCQIYNETLLIGERSEPCFCQIYNETLLIGERSEPCFCQIYNETLLIGERSEPCFYHFKQEAEEIRSSINFRFNLIPCSIKMEMDDDNIPCNQGEPPKEMVSVNLARFNCNNNSVFYHFKQEAEEIEPKEARREQEREENENTLPETNQDSTNVVEIEPEQATLNKEDDSSSEQPRKRKPKRKSSPSLLPTRRSKRLESVVSSVGVLQSEESSNTTPVHAEHPVGEVVLDDVQSVEDTVQGISQMSHTDQDSTNVVEIAPEQTTLTDEDKILSEQPRKRKPKRKRSPSLLPARRSKRLATVDSLVGVLQLPEECCNAAVQNGAETHREVPQEQVELHFARDVELAQTVSKVWSESQKPGCSKDPIYMAEGPILKTVEHPVDEVVLDEVQSVEDTVQGISQMSHTDQDSTNVVEIALEQTTLTDEDKILSKQPRKRKPKRKRSPSLLPARRSKRLASVDSSVGVLQLPEECCNTALQNGAETHREVPQEQVGLHFAHDGELAQTVSKVWSESQKPGCSKDPIYMAEGPILKTVEHPVDEVVLDEVQSVEDTVQGISQMSHTDQDSTNVVEIALEQTTLTDEDKILSKQPRKRKPKRKRSPSLLPARRSKRLASVDSSVGVLQLPEECCNTALQNGAETHREVPQEQVGLHFAHDGELAQTVSKVWSESQKPGCSKDPIYMAEGPILKTVEHPVGQYMLLLLFHMSCKRGQFDLHNLASEEPCFYQLYIETLQIGERSEPCFYQLYVETLQIGERSEPCFYQLYIETLQIGERSEPCFCQLYIETFQIGERSEPCFYRTLFSLFGERSEPVEPRSGSRFAAKRQPLQPRSGVGLGSR
ncbi:hypothetical protein FQR65_LT16179 [Abscondita terminalis]|nr:hypothetical protein FQR65_LT16179 [Abscondita terminalis]